MRDFLQAVDARVTDWLLAHPGMVPRRWARFLAYQYPDARVRRTYLRVFGVQMGEASFANLGLVVITDPANPETQVRIGERVSIGPNVSIICDSRPNNSPLLGAIPHVRDSMSRTSPVVIESDAWIGAGAVILPGVHIGRGAIVGAGSIVLTDVAPFHVVAGNPARVIRVLDTNPETF